MNTKPNDLSKAPWVRPVMIPIVRVHTHLDHVTMGWTLRAVQHDGKSVRCSVYRFGLRNLTREQAETLQKRVLERKSINLAYWKLEPSSPYASDMGL
jgi:hypothetical protein